jgi:hypothetical protein
MALLLIAGIDTTWSAIGASLWHLAKTPGDRKRLIAEPGLLPTAMEEFLRAYAPVTMARLVKDDMHWRGADMKADDWILLSPLPSPRTGSAPTSPRLPRSARSSSAQPTPHFVTESDRVGMPEPPFGAQGTGRLAAPARPMTRAVPGCSPPRAARRQPASSPNMAGHSGAGAPEPPICAAVGSMPVTTRAVQIGAICVRPRAGRHCWPTPAW